MQLLDLAFDLPFERVIEELARRNVVLPDTYYGSLEGLHRQLAFSIAGVSSLDQLQLVLNSLTESVASGTTFAEWQKNVDVKALGLPKHRLDNIFRTNTQNAYNRGRWEQFQEDKEDFPYLMYDAINDTRTRPSHSAMDGIIRHVDDPFWNTHYPPNGFRCRCKCIVMTESQANRRSKEGGGLNKAIDESTMKPDKNWDYNIGKDLNTGVNQAIQERKNNPDIEPRLKVLIDALARFNNNE